VGPILLDISRVPYNRYCVSVSSSLVFVSLYPVLSPSASYRVISTRQILACRRSPRVPQQAPNSSQLGAPRPCLRPFTNNLINEALRVNLGEYKLPRNPSHFLLHVTQSRAAQLPADLQSYRPADLARGFCLGLSPSQLNLVSTQPNAAQPCRRLRRRISDPPWRGTHSARPQSIFRRRAS
jgi:hypothetical protein